MEELSGLLGRGFPDGADERPQGVNPIGERFLGLQSFGVDAHGGGGRVGGIDRFAHLDGREQAAAERGPKAEGHTGGFGGEGQLAQGKVDTVQSAGVCDVWCVALVCGDQRRRENQRAEAAGRDQLDDPGQPGDFIIADVDLVDGESRGPRGEAEGGDGDRGAGDVAADAVAPFGQICDLNVTRSAKAEGIEACGCEARDRFGVDGVEIDCGCSDGRGHGLPPVREGTIVARNDAGDSC